MTLAYTRISYLRNITCPNTLQETTRKLAPSAEPQIFNPRTLPREKYIMTSETAEAFRKWRDIGQKGHFCILPKSNDFMSLTSRTKIFENMAFYNVGNGLYRVFTTAKRAHSFQLKRAIIQEILFSFFKWGTLAQRKIKGTFFTLKKVGRHLPYCPPPGSATIE